MRVKLIKLDDRYDNYNEEIKNRIGKIFEALKFVDKYETNEKYKEMYALGLEDGVWFVPALCCEVIEEKTMSIEEFKTKPLEIIPNTTDRFLLVEDGSVDVDSIEELGIKCIIYRSGANKPEWL